MCTNRVTAVGATMMSRTRSGGPPEHVACMASAGGVITTGGGFANLTSGGGATPRWQVKVVSQYIEAHKNASTWPLQRELNPGYDYLVSCLNTSSSKPCIYGRGANGIITIQCGARASAHIYQI